MPGLYSTLLGSRWHDLSDAVKELHVGDATTVVTGEFRIEHGKRLGAHLLVRLLGMPREAAAAPAQLVIKRTHAQETWRRIFGDSAFSTTQFGTPDGMLAERFGPIELRFRLEVIGSSLVLDQVAATIRISGVAVRLPTCLSPRVSAREELDAEGNRIRVSVALDVPLLGRLVIYSGTVAVVKPHS